jgi:uncharacterized membrane protein (UPF0127 family)
MRLVKRAKGRVIADRVERADSFWKRFRGLMFRRKFLAGDALLFRLSRPKRYGIHMFFVRFPIDLLYLDSKFTVVELRSRLKPWRTYRSKAKASYLVELPAGTISRTRAKVGDKLVLENS